MIGFTQSSYPAYYLPSDEDYKTLPFVIAPQRWVKDLEYASFFLFFSSPNRFAFQYFFKGAMKRCVFCLKLNFYFSFVALWRDKRGITNQLRDLIYFILAHFWGETASELSLHRTSSSVFHLYDKRSIKESGTYPHSHRSFCSCHLFVHPPDKQCRFGMRFGMSDYWLDKLHYY